VSVTRTSNKKEGKGRKAIKQLAQRRALQVSLAVSSRISRQQYKFPAKIQVAIVCHALPSLPICFAALPISLLCIALAWLIESSDWYQWLQWRLRSASLPSRCQCRVQRIGCNRHVPKLSIAVKPHLGIHIHSLTLTLTLTLSPITDEIRWYHPIANWCLMLRTTEASTASTRPLAHGLPMQAKPRLLLRVLVDNHSISAKRTNALVRIFQL
jgi:hypothetical protein